jgi:hypothetical protein
MRTNVIAKYDELLANCLTSKGARAADVCSHVFEAHDAAAMDKSCAHEAQSYSKGCGEQ